MKEVNEVWRYGDARDGLDSGIWIDIEKNQKSKSKMGIKHESMRPRDPKISKKESSNLSRTECCVVLVFNSSLKILINGKTAQTFESKGIPVCEILLQQGISRNEFEL